MKSQLCFLLPLCFYAITQTRGDGAVTVSNLGNSASGNWVVGNGVSGSPQDFPRANSFTTGAGPGWTLNSLTLSLEEFFTVSGSITVEVFSDNAGAPGTSITVFSGPDPVGLAAADYTYTPDSTLSLSALTTYWVVASGPFEGALPDSYAWSRTADTSESTADPGWSIGDDTLEATSGNSNVTWDNWTPVSVNQPVRFSVDATAVPEPSSIGFCALGVVSLLLGRRRKAA